MRIGFLFPQMIGIGGAERWLMCMLKGLSDHAALVGVAIKGDLPVEERQVRNVSRYCPVYNGPDAIERVAPHSDVVITWGTQHRLDEYLGAYRRKGLKVVLTAHSVKPMCCGEAHEQWADGLVAVSRVATGFFPDSAQHRVEIINPGVDPDRCCPSRPRDELRAYYGYGPTDRVVGFLGRFAHEKNPLAVTRSVPTLGPGWHAFMVGSGPAEGVVQSSIDGLPFGRHIVVPAMEQVGDALAVMDCMVVPSQYETFCLSAVEAWFAGVPLIMTPTGVRVEFEARHGPLSAPIPFDPPTMVLADAIRQATHPAFLGIADKARRLAWEKLNHAAAGRRWMAYLRRLLNPA